MPRPTEKQWANVVKRTRNLEKRLELLEEKDYKRLFQTLCYGTPRDCQEDFMALRVFLKCSKAEQKED